MIENHLAREIKDEELGCPDNCPYDNCDGECRLKEDKEDKEWARVDWEYETEKIYGGMEDKK